MFTNTIFNDVDDVRGLRIPTAALFMDHHPTLLIRVIQVFMKIPDLYKRHIENPEI